MPVIVSASIRVWSLFEWLPLLGKSEVDLLRDPGILNKPLEGSSVPGFIVR